MKRKFTLPILFLIASITLCPSTAKLMAQTIHSDSLRRAAFSRDSIKQDSMKEALKIQSIARQDARKLKLSTAEKQRFESIEKNPASDIFKPQVGVASNDALLSDSTYVKAFRLAAYRKALDEGNKSLRCYWGETSIGQNSARGLTSSQIGNIELSGGQLITGEFTEENIPNTTLVNFGVLYGGILKQQFSFFTPSAGLCFVTEFQILGPAPLVGIGVPILLQGYLLAGQFAGIGIGAYLNLNSVQTTAGINISIALGKLTTHKINK